MGAGRPSEGIGHVDRLEGSEEEKRRLRIVLETLSGERSVREACEALSVSESRFHEMRHEALQAALDGLVPGRAGRPAKMDEASTSRVAELEREVAELKIELQAALVRTEIALTMPHVLRGAEDEKKKLGTKEKRRRKR